MLNSWKAREAREARWKKRMTGWFEHFGGLMSPGFAFILGFLFHHIGMFTRNSNPVMTSSAGGGKG